MADRYGGYPPQGYGHGYAQPPQHSVGYQSGQPQYSHPHAPAIPQHEGPNYRWFVSGEGIRRDVIQADIQRYLGPDALVKPGHDHEGRPGYWIAAYRTLTATMVADLKADTANFERSGARGSYQDSTIHQSRHHWGPTINVGQSSTVHAPVATLSHSTQYGPTGGYAPPTAYAPPAAYVPPAQDRSPAHYAQPASAYSHSLGYSHPPSGYPTPSTSSGASGTSASPGSNYSNSNYTHGSGRSQQSQSSQGSNYYAETPRTLQPVTQNYSQHPTAQPQSQSNPPVASAGSAPAGYYLASDGRYYPNATRR